MRSESYQNGVGFLAGLDNRCGLVAIQHWHLEVHKYDLVLPVATALLLLKFENCLEAGFAGI